MDIPADRNVLMRTRTSIILLSVVAVLAAAPVEAQQLAGPKTKVPRWDARGVGPLPWQGIAWLDVNGDATRIALGTMAPPAGPNVPLLDGEGRLVRSQHAGQRWINQVTLGRGATLRA